MIHNTASIRVRYADTDKMGVVYNGVYLQYFEIGRTEMLRAMGLPYIVLEESGVLLPVLEAHLLYQKPAKYDDVLDIDATFVPDYSATIRIDYVIRRNHDVLASGFTRHSFVHATSFKPIRPPAIFTDAVRLALNK